MAEGIEVDIETFAAALDDDAVVVDVRTAEEYAQGHVPGARLLPLDELGMRLHEVPKDRRVYIICAVGGRSVNAAGALNQAGWDAVSVSGGTKQWIEEGRPYVVGLDPR